MTVTLLFDTLLRTVAWSQQRTSVGTADAVPEAVSGLLHAGSDAEADPWYWKLDNRVVVQGQLFTSAVALVPVLLAALLTDLKEAARYWVLELLMQIAAGESHVSEVERDLGDAARRSLREGLWILYGLMSDESPRVRAAAIDLLALVDLDQSRVAIVAQAHLAADGAEEVRRAISRLGD